MTSAEVVERFLSSCPALNRHRPGNDRVSPSGYVDGCSQCRRNNYFFMVCESLLILQPLLKFQSLRGSVRHCCIFLYYLFLCTRTSYFPIYLIFIKMKRSSCFNLIFHFASPRCFNKKLNEAFIHSFLHPSIQPTIIKEKFQWPFKLVSISVTILSGGSWPSPLLCCFYSLHLLVVGCQHICSKYQLCEEDVEMANTLMA